jgi:hypothetical protein
MQHLSHLTLTLLLATPLALGCGDDGGGSPDAATDTDGAVEPDGATDDAGQPGGDGGEPDDGGVPPGESPALGVYELTAYRTGPCDGLTDETPLPFAYFAIDVGETTGDFLLRSCADPDSCAGGVIEDGFGPEGGTAESPFGIGTSQSYDENADECRLRVAERAILVPTAEGYTWRLEDYRGSVVVPVDDPAFNCLGSAYDPAPLLDELDDCPSIEEYVGTRVE